MTDPARFARIRTPVRLLYGAQIPVPFSCDGVRCVAEHVADTADAHVRAVAGIGDLDPMGHPGPVAEALASFFGTDDEPPR